MKKLTVLLTALLMIFAAFTALAAEPAPAPAVPGEEPGTLSPYADIVTVEGENLTYGHPRALMTYALTEEVINSGVLHAYYSEEGWMMTVTCIDPLDNDGNPVESAEKLLEYYTAEGIDAVMDEVNGLQAIRYNYAEGNSCGLAFMCEDGKLITIAFYPADDEGMREIIALVEASIKPAE